MGKAGWFDNDEDSAKLSRLGNPLEKLGAAVDFEMFRPELERHLPNHARKGNAGCRPYDVVLMFKIALIKHIYGLSDGQAEYQVTDRLSFREFPGLSGGDAAPDSRTLWAFQDALSRKGLAETLFARFHAHLEGLGLIVNKGKIIDATFVEAPRQRNTRGENDAIKSGGGGALWAGQPRKRCQKDTDARWARKDGENHYGYKCHAKVDADSKLIEAYAVTSAEVHDSRAVASLVGAGDRGQDLHADSAYVGAEVERTLRACGAVPQVTGRASRGKPLTDAQKASNRAKSRTRCRVEHTFGFVANSLGGFFVRTVGLTRARCAVGLINLVCNLFRYEQIVRLRLLPAGV
jgi:IS5 family transposase